jgi:hypothetical protein
VCCFVQACDAYGFGEFDNSLAPKYSLVCHKFVEEVINLGFIGSS